MEVIELMSPPKREIAGEELKGRQTGSLEWRISRGECGTSGNEEFGGSFHPTQTEMQAKVFHLEFDPVSNEYKRPLAEDQSKERIKGWQKGAKEAENMFRKVEHDWDMVYLSRAEGTTKASITWALDLSKTNLSVKTVELLVNSKTYENGRIIWQRSHVENAAI